MKWRRLLLIGVLILVINAVIVIFVYLQLDRSNSPKFIGQWFRQPETRPTLMTYNAEPCDGAPFLLPSSGFIGLMWRDPSGPYNILRRHTGIDIFGDGEPGEVPVQAVYDGYLTRLDDWFSTVIIRHEDPLQPGRTIWTYYTHMANRAGTESFVSEQFPPGTQDVFVKQGELLGFQGEYSGSGPAVGLHVHLSIVLSEDDGSFKNEAVLNNTLDPSPYFGLPLNISDLPKRPVQCGSIE